MGKRWIAGAIKHPGALRRKLGVKEGEKIPASKLVTRKGDTTTTKRQKSLAKTLRKL